MEKKRPQLSLDELHQLKWLLGGGLTLLAVWTVFYMDLGGWSLMAITTLAAGACVRWPTLPARVPALAHTLAFPVIVAVFLGDLWLNAEVLPAIVRLDMLLLLYRGISYRQRRDDLQVVVMGLFLIVVAGVLTVSLMFALQILLYTGCALGFLLVITLVDAGETGQRPTLPADGVPPWAARADWRRLVRRLREVADWRVLALGGGVFAGVVGLSALLFLAIPRFQLENSLFLERFVVKKARTGFTDSIKFGEVSEIQQDTGVALSVDVSDRTKVPAEPYWRMVVLDQYDHGTFKLSPELRLMSFRGERSGGVAHGAARPQLGAVASWTFYLESGVSRYLPLTGAFELLRFREPQNFVSGTALGIVALRDYPVTMTAYRVDGLDTTGALSDPDFAKRWRARDSRMPVRAALQNRLMVNAADATRLRQAADQIAAGNPALAAGEFARRAGEWLRKNHPYSLSPTIPAGEGDPLVRWAVSREAGHCELFAGSLVLLARAAGFPARVVTGFRGGTWNGYSNNLTIRNSDAHAWAEVFDDASGAWLRADALASGATARSGEAQGEAALAAQSDRSWTARFESLRVFWYRRIVNFDQRSQVETLRTMKDATQNAGRRLRAAMDDAVASVKGWLTAPWDRRRVAKVLGAILGLAGLAWAGWRFRFSILNFRFRRVGRHEDPVRREAGRWLARLRGVGGDEWRVAGEEWAGAIADLQRLRFGARATWPEPDKVFRRARRAWREVRSGGAAAARHRGRITSA
jgi:transglutaminase-like putative cysteine protease